MTAPHTITFARCRVEVWPITTYLRTVFEYEVDGVGYYREAKAAPVYSAGYAEKAVAWGHTSAWQMCLYHEIGHTFVCERLGLDYSPVLFAEAHGIKRPGGFHAREESLVIAFCQRALGKPWDKDVPESIRAVLQGGVAQFVDLVGGLE